MVLIKLGKSATARGQLEQVLDLSRVIGNQFQQIKTMLQMVYVLQNEGEMAQAQKFASDAVQLAQANGMENMTARWLADLGDTFLIRGDYTEADTYYQQALDFAQRAKSRRNEARALLSLGSLRIQMSNADEAVRYVEQALPFYQQGNYQKETAQALTLLGRANRLKGDYDAALRAFYQQLQAAEQVDDLSQKSLSHEGIGTVLAQQERYPEALRHFEERYALSNKLGDQKSITYALTERGTMLWQLGRYDEAQEVLKEAFALAARPDGGNKALLATIHLVTSEMMLSQRRFTEAKAESQSAITLAGTQSTDLALQAKYVLGQALVFSGAKAEGRALCDDAVAMATKLGDAWLLTAALLALSKSLIENGEWREALNSARRAQEQFARSGQTESKWRAWLIMARASTYIGNEFQAVEQAESASHSLLDLQQQWGNDIFTRYSSRPDNQILIEQLNALKIREKALVHK
jgi:tetratricopeptide (TPR) repeat protein